MQYLICVRVEFSEKMLRSEIKEKSALKKNMILKYNRKQWKGRESAREFRLSMIHKYRFYL